MRRHIRQARTYLSHLSSLRTLLTLRHLFYLFGAILACLIVGVPAYLYFKPTSTNRLEMAIRSLNFIPINPPSNLRAPGTIYVIDKDGEVKSALCWADTKDLKDYMHESPTETRDTQSLRQATFDSSAKITESLKEQMKGDLVESVSFSLEKVSVLEISIRDLRALSGALQKDPSCGNSVYDYLRAGEHICQGQQVLRASAKYSIRTKREVSGEIAAKLNDAVRATIDPKAVVDGSTITTGEGLFYGMRLAPLCMALDDASLAPPPRSFKNRLLARFGLL